MDSKHVYAVADFRGEQGEISFKRGSKIIVVAQHNNGWWLGRNEAGEVGNFPSNYVQKTPVTASTPSKAPIVSRATKSSDVVKKRVPFCIQCKKEATGKFCRECGTRLMEKEITVCPVASSSSSSSSPSATNKFVTSTSSSNTNRRSFGPSSATTTNNTNKFVTSSSSSNNNTNKFVTSSSSSNNNTNKFVTSSSNNNTNKFVTSSSSSNNNTNKFVSPSNTATTASKFGATTTASNNRKSFGSPSTTTTNSPTNSPTNKFITPSKSWGTPSSSPPSSPSSTPSSPSSALATANKFGSTTTASNNRKSFGSPSTTTTNSPTNSPTNKFRNTTTITTTTTSQSSSPSRPLSFSSPSRTNSANTPTRQAPQPQQTRQVPSKPLPTPSKPLPSPSPSSSSPSTFSLTSAPTSFLKMDDLPAKPLPKPPSKQEDGGERGDEKKLKREKKKRQIAYQPEEPKLPMDNLNKQLLSSKARRWNASIPRLTGQPAKAVVEWDFEKSNDSEIGLTRGVIVEVLEATTNEWWEVKSEGKTGYVAASYLRVVEWKKPGEADIARAAAAEEAKKITSEDLDKKEKMRCHILQELLATEKQYVGSLKQFLNEYEAPLVAMKKSLIKKNVIEQIFSPVKSILEVNNKVLALLEPPIQLMMKDPANIRTPQVIPPIMNGLVSMKADFEVYSKYIIDFDEVTTLVGSLSSSKPKFGNFLVEAQAKCKGLDFGAFFIMPVQRVPRYELLVRELIKNSIKPDSANGLGEKGMEEEEVWSSLQKAKKSLADIGEMVNETKREQEQYEVLLALQEQVSPPLPGLATRGRALLKQGVLQQAEFKKSTRKLTERYAFAFSDIFLICEVESTLLGSKTYHPQAVWPFKNDQISLEFPSDMATWGLPKDIYEKLGSAFHIKTPFEFASFFCSSKEELAEWLAVIEPNIAHVNRG